MQIFDFVECIFPSKATFKGCKNDQRTEACSPMIMFFTGLCFFFFFFNLFIIYFWLRWVFVAARGLSLVEASEGYSSLRCMGFSLRWLLLLQSTGSRHLGFSSCGTQAQ